MSVRLCRCASLILVFSLPFLAGAAPSPTLSRRPAYVDTDRHIDVNQINMWVTNVGSFAWDIATGNAGLVYPRGSGHTAVFAAGLWLAGQHSGQIRATVAEYSQEYGPGPMIGTSPSDPGAADAKVYKVVRWTGNPQDTAHVERTPAELAADPQLDGLYHHSWSEYMNGAAPKGAPWRLYRLPNPNAPGDSVDVAGPDVLGDEMLWTVYNDADPALHTNQAGESAPLGVEVQQTTFAFAAPADLASTVFLRYRLINKSASTIDQAFAAVWSDPDVGGFTDDLVGCDVSSNLGYAYNGTNADVMYGSTPPAVGFDVFHGPDSTGMYSFNKFIGGTDPSTPIQTYNFMRGLNPDGTPLVNPTNGMVTRYYDNGDPATGVGWLDQNPGDRRMMLSSGPFTFAAGETVEVWAGLIIGRGFDRLDSIASLRARDAAAQAVIDGGTVLALPSVITARVVDGRVEVEWLASGSGASSVQVERREVASDWQQVGVAAVDGTGRIRWIDSDVQAGGRYGYRLVVDGLAAGEVWVDMPVGVLALERLINPSLGSLAFSLALPSGAPATLELFDALGRRVLRREVSGAGQHVIDLSAGLRSGLYFLRLTQSAAKVEARAVFLK